MIEKINNLFVCLFFQDIVTWFEVETASMIVKEKEKLFVQLPGEILMFMSDICCCPNCYSFQSGVITIAKC